jgi:DNA-binding NarL/FixJ family response regulator
LQRTPHTLTQGLAPSAGASAASAPRVAFITIGQAPRTDVVPDLLARIAWPVDAVEFGALDDVDEAGLRRLAPGPHDLCLHTRLRRGSEVVVAADAIEERVARLCRTLDRQAFDLVVVVTTGLSRRIDTHTPLVHGQQAVDAWIDALITANSRIGVIFPLERQLKEARFVHGTSVQDLAACALQDRDDSVTEAAERLKNCDLVVMHSVGYTEATAREVAELTHKPVVTARHILAAAVRLQLRELHPAVIWDDEALADSLSRVFPGLTPREREVTLNVANGLSNKAIGRALGISHRTVEIHRARAMEKLGVTTVPGLMRRLLLLRGR